MSQVTLFRDFGTAVLEALPVERRGKAGASAGAGAGGGVGGGTGGGGGAALVLLTRDEVLNAVRYGTGSSTPPRDCSP